MTNSSYDQLINQYPQDQQAAAVRQNLFNVAGNNPDEEAGLQDLAGKYGAPVDSVRFNQPDYQRRATLDSLDYGRLVADYPATAGLLANPQAAAIAHDDVGNLSGLEGLLKFQANNRRLLASGYFALGEGVAGGLQAGAEQLQGLLEPLAGSVLPVNPAQPLAQALNDIRQNQAGWRRYFQGDAADYVTSPDSWARNLEQGSYAGMQSLSQSLMALPYAALSRNPATALQMLAFSSGGQSYGKARDAAVEPNRALLYGAADAAIEYGTEQFGLQHLFSGIKAGSPLLGTLRGFLARELPGEQALPPCRI